MEGSEVAAEVEEVAAVVPQEDLPDAHQVVRLHPAVHVVQVRQGVLGLEAPL